MRVSLPSVRQCNKLLSCLVIGFGVYLTIQPFVPELVYFVRRARILGELRMFGLSDFRSDETTVLRLVTPRVSMAADGPHTLVAPVPAENTLIIPDIDVRANILEGTSSQILMEGIWHRPGTGTPDTGGNTVLVGHRFLYTSGPNTFYHLDKLKAGDPLTVYWKGQRYTYIIDSSTVTSADSFEIEQNTAQPVLTLYTCTPLFSIDKRLVVRARQVAASSVHAVVANQ
ncbi:MAG: class E sortase [Candidatus Doudnabacteria bacterium]|nr:class E sortase [Candidatus Doudnabacteria bacterium]